MSNTEFEGMNVLAVACSSGIGLSAAHILLKGGAKVVVSSRSQSSCDAAVQGYENGFGVAGNAGSTEDMTAVVQKARELFGGPISHVIYAATAIAMLPMSHPNTEELIQTFTSQNELNINGLVLVFKLVVEDLIATKGALVSVSSVSSFLPHFGLPGYNSAKAAQNMLIQNMALEVGRDGVRVNVVSPGVVETPIFDGLGPAKDMFLGEANHRNVMGRYGQPDEIGHLIAFLLSKKASYITGQNIVADGGMSLISPITDMWTPLLIPEEQRKPGHLLISRGGYKPE